MPEAEAYPGVYVEELPAGGHTIGGAPTSVAAFVGAATEGPLDTPVRLAGFADFVRTFGGLSPASPMSHAVSHFFLNGGEDAVVVRVAKGESDAIDASVVSDPALDAGSGRGIYALRRAEGFNLLCVPPFALGADIDGRTRRAAAGLCAERRAVFIADPPADWASPDDAAAADLAAIGLEPSPSAALYFPRLRAALDGGEAADFAPCGAVAGVIARTDRERGVWKAPAGIEATLRGFTGLAMPIRDSDSGRLNPLGINCLRDLPGAGPVVWGARTLEGADRLASNWKYLPVRRLALFIEESLLRGMDWVVFEPNDERLWAELRLAVGAFLDRLFRQGAFRGTRPHDAYFVRCDSGTTDADDIAAGVVNVVIGFAPLRPAEFVVIHLRQSALSGR